MRVLLFCLGVSAFGAAANAAPFLVGVGKADSTPGFVDLKTMGYGSPIPTTSGLHTRLHVRAVSIRATDDAALPAPYTRDLHIALVDTCFITQKLKIDAVAALRQKFGDRFSLANTVISATHTHNAPAGTSTYGHYQISSGGFVPEVYAAQLEAIVNAFSAAQATQSESDLSFVEGQLAGVSRNRSLAAFLRNPDDEQAEFPRHVSTDALAVFAHKPDRQEKLALHLFPVHPTTADKSNPMIQGDNKGLAAILDERATKAVRAPGAVTMFVNGGAGDASPNVLGDVDGNGDWDCAATDAACTRWSAERHQAHLSELRTADAITIDGPMAVTHGYFDLNTVDTPAGSTCPAAFGLSMLAGSLEDGPGTPLTTEGVSCSSSSPLAILRCAMVRFACHGQKPVMLPTGYRGDVRTPHHLPFQVIRLGGLALVTVPSEVTTVATWRIRQAVLSKLAPSGVEAVHLIGYANAYAAYVTTPEEYDAQHYEGASTLFGRHTLDAFIKILTDLASDVREGAVRHRGVAPSAFADLTQPGKTNPIKIARSLLRRGSRYGDVAVAPRRSYRRGDTLTLSYNSPNPNLFPLRGSSYVEIQHDDGGVWQTVYTDDDPETTLSWEQKPASRMTMTWSIPADAPAGEYRIVYRALASPSSRQLLTKYVAVSVAD